MRFFRKSALCCIVKCGRSPHPKCCTQKKEEQTQVTTTTKAAVTEMILEFTTLKDKDAKVGSTGTTKEEATKNKHQFFLATCY